MTVSEYGDLLHACAHMCYKVQCARHFYCVLISKGVYRTSCDVLSMLLVVQYCWGNSKPFHRLFWSDMLKVRQRLSGLLQLLDQISIYIDQLAVLASDNACSTRSTVLGGLVTIAISSAYPTGAPLSPSQTRSV